MENEILLNIVNQLNNINSTLDTMNGKFNTIDGKLDIIDGRLDAVDGRLDIIDGRLDAVDSRLDTIDGRLDNHDSKFDILFKEMQNLKDITLRMELEHGEKISALFDAFSYNNDMYSKLDARITDLEDITERHSIKLLHV